MQKPFDGGIFNDLSPELEAEMGRARKLTEKYNCVYEESPEDGRAILRELLGDTGKDSGIEPAFHCKFGYNIFIGDNVYINRDCIILDSARVEIGCNVLIGPRVGIYASNHAIDAAERAHGLCIAKPVKIEDNVWIGAGVHVLAGITIGENSVIGAGSVVSSDIPANVIAAGIPCRVLRSITEADKISR